MTEVLKEFQSRRDTGTLENKPPNSIKMKNDLILPTRPNNSARDSRQLLQTIYEAGKLIGLSIWEIEAFIRLVSKKKSHLLGVKILTKYHELDESIFQLLQKRTEVINIFVDAVKDISVKYDAIPDSIRLIAEYSLQIWLCLCYIRQIQWGPSPFFLQRGNQLSPTFLEDNHTLAKYLFATFTEGPTHDIYGSIGKIHLLIITCPILHDDAIARMYQAIDSPQQDEYNKLDDIGLTNRPVVTCLRELFQHEISAENLWRVYQSLPTSSRSDIIPTLRMSYDGGMTNHHFNNTKVYRKCSETIRAILDTYTSYSTTHYNFLFDQLLVEMKQLDSTTTSKQNKLKLDTHCSDDLKNALLSPVLTPLKPCSTDTNIFFPPDQLTLNSSRSIVESSKSNRREIPKEQLIVAEESSTLIYVDESISYPASRKGSFSMDRRHSSASMEIQPFNNSKSKPQAELNDKRPISAPASEHVVEDLVEHPQKVATRPRLSSIESIATDSSDQPPISKKIDVEVESILKSLPAKRQTFIKPVVALQSPNTQNRNLIGNGLKREKEQVVEFKIPCDNGSIPLLLEKILTEGNVSRFIVKGYTNGCGALIMRDILLGDEIIAVNGAYVEGKSLKEVVTVLQSMKNTRGVVSNLISLRIRRYYAGWENAVELEGVDVNKSLTNSPNFRRKRATSEDVVENSENKETNNVNISKGDIAELEMEIYTKRSEIDSVELNLRQCDNSNDLLLNKQKLLQLIDEMSSLTSKLLERKQQYAIQETKVKELNIARKFIHQSSTKQLTQNLEKRLHKLTPQSSVKSITVKTNEPVEESKGNHINAPVSSPVQVVRSLKNVNLHAETKRIPQKTGMKPRGWSGQKKIHSDSSHIHQTLKYSLHKVERDKSGEWSPQQIAAKKIIVWWEYIYPRKRLSKRLATRKMVGSILNDIVKSATDIAYRQMKIRYDLLRHGAAVKIQRAFRNWVTNVLNQVLILQQAFRRYLARKKVRHVVTLVRAAVLIFRYVYKRKKRIDKMTPKNKLLRRILHYFLDYVGVMHKKQQQALLMQKLGGQRIRGSFLQKDSRRIQVFAKMVRASTAIQSAWRRKMAYVRVANLRLEQSMAVRIKSTFLIYQMNRRIIRKAKRNKAALKIQKFVRGAHCRNLLLIKVLAAFKITACWHKYRQYKKLKQCLRRLELPRKIVIHGITNIATKLVHTKDIRIKVSVWWTSLLHLVEESDIQTVIDSKGAQIVRQTSMHKIIENQVSLNIKVPPKTPPRLTLQTPTASSQRSTQLPNTTSRATNPTSLQAFVAKQAQRQSIVQHNRMKFQPTIGSVKDDQNGDDSSSSSSSSEDSDVKDDDVNEVGDKEDEVSSKKSEGDKPLSPTNLQLSAFECSTESTKSKSKFMSSFSNVMKLPFSGITTDSDEGSVDENATALQPVFDIGNKIIGTFNISKIFTPSQSLKGGELENQQVKVPIYICNFEDETIYIPGCHGNAVIQFDIFDGEKKFGTALFRMSTERGLMFWGGEQKLEVNIDKKVRIVQLGQAATVQTQRSRMTSDESNPLLEVRIATGIPMRCKCGFAHVLVRGTGPMKRKMRTKGFIKSFLDSWDRLYLSFDGETLYFYKKKTSHEATLSLAISDVKAIRLETSTTKIAAAIQDIMDIVITTVAWDDIHIKCEDGIDREDWLQMLNECWEDTKDGIPKSLQHLRSSGLTVAPSKRHNRRSKGAI